MGNSEAYEARFAEASRPQFTPSEPGTYTLKVTADLVNPDPLFPQVVHAESSVDIVVTGPSTGGGCSMAPGGTGRSAGTMGLFAMAGLAVLGMRRRRR